jgi:uncharacterized membrane protein
MIAKIFNIKHRHFIDRVDDAKILAAIKKAEARTTGQIRLLVARRPYPDAYQAAEKHFKAMRLDQPPHKDVVLIFVAPQSHTFALYTGSEIHARTGPEFWNTLRDEMKPHLKDSRFTEALLHAIDQIGAMLATHFPKSSASQTA